MRPLTLLTACAVLFLAACSSAESRRGRERGIAEAERDIAAGQPAMLFLGLPMADRHVIDPATGLPEWSGGCEVGDESNAFVGAYNARMREAFAEGRLRGLTLAHKRTTWGAVDARFRSATPATLTLDGPAVDVPGGRFRVSYARYEPHPEAVRFVYVEDLVDGTRDRTQNLSLDAVEVLFADDGTTLLLRREPGRGYATIDLPRAIVIEALRQPAGDAR